MKTFKNKSVLQKILIAIMIVVTLSCSIPKPVQAAGGILLSPIVALMSTILDGVQWALEWAMLGESNDFMKDPWIEGTYDPPVDENVSLPAINESDLDGTLWGWDSVNVPDINYTPQEIFSNRVPALDINFLNPSVKTGNEETDQKMNVAVKLQPVISSWYVAIRTLAIVGLLSVLVYLGIRMILSGVAADKAKYKKMLMDWVVAMCLVFGLHYIMSLVLTGAELVTSMIASNTTGTVNISVVGGAKPYSFSANLMSYVRFMMQSKDTMQGITFLALYLMLVIYNVRFTWTYLKRVVNMAFLTLIAPIVALTYPIDKVSDGKAQAFDMWIKEFVFNALLQPLHLLLYIVLLGSATELAIDNPLYAIVALGFIFAGEGLLKKMFGFGKAGAGTVGSLAGAVGVSNLASQALMGLAKGPGGKGGAGNGKVRTNDQTQRDGKNTGANKGYDSFDKDSNQGIDTLTGGNEQQSESDKSNNYNNNLDDGVNPSLSDMGRERRDELIAEGFTPDDPEWKQAESELGESFNGIDTGNESGNTNEGAQPIGNPRVQEAMEDLGPEEPETWRSLYEKDKQEKEQRKLEKQQIRQEKFDSIKDTLANKDGKRDELFRKAGVGAYKTIRGIKKAAPTAAYKVARGALSLGARGLAAGVIGATAGVIGATTGDGDKAISMAMTGAGVGLATGDNMFEASLGKVMQNKSVRDSYGAGKYGSAIDARNEKADKLYLKSDEHKEEYEKYFKEGKFQMSKKEFDEATKSYREAGITNKKDIRKALRLEKQYRDKGGNLEDVRGKVQNIVQTYDGVDKRAVYGNDKATEAALKNIESQLSNVADAKQRRAVANEILQGYRDWYNVG